MNKLFIRNDDVKDKLDRELIDITELILSRKAIISHAVEPANLSNDVVEWLLYQKKSYPSQIEIIQHGYDHNARGLYPLGNEFGGIRDFNSQYDDMKAGIELMDNYFGDYWDRIMAFPYGRYNNSTLKAVEALKYKAITSSVDFSLLHKIKDVSGRVFKRDIILGKRISYHGKLRSKYNFYDYGTSVNIIKKYKGYDQADHYTLNELIDKINLASKNTKYIGILLHHRFHKDKLDLLSELLDYCQKSKFIYSKISTLNI